MSEHRWVRLDGADNVRDLGGLPVRGGGVTRFGVLLRAATLQQLTSDDVARLRELGLRTVIDLRTPAESAAEGHGLLRDEPIEIVHVPLVPDEKLLTEGARRILAIAERPVGTAARIERYLDYLRFAGPAVARTVSRLARPETVPAVFHCAAGKDRTGTIAALVLDAVGVDREAIVADYASSNQALDRVVDRLLQLPTYAPAVEQMKRSDLMVDPDVMRGVLDRLDREHGGAAGWLSSVGLTDAELTALRDLLVESGN